ncbi:MAG: ABZJ_00895 family protein [Hyphomicrobiaceae bacterium]|nr:ABZJ_00895 family protein [Hyphomicrobiaceae bacterium]
MLMEQKTSLTPYVVRFAWVYAAFSIAAIIIVSLLQMSSNTGLAIGILMASAIAAGQKFITDNKRVFLTGEKLRMASYSLLIVIFLSAILAIGVLGWAEVSVEAFLSEMMGAFSSRTILAISALIVLANFAALYVAYSFVLNMIYKSMVKRGEV